MKKPRTYYALCLGTFNKHVAVYLRDMMKVSPSCTVEFIFRERANNRVAVYVRIKRSLERAIKLAEVRDKMLSVVDQRNR